MAVPAYATDLNDIFIDGGGTAWTLVGGGRQTDPETDDYIQGSSCWSHDPFSSGIEGGVYNSTETVASSDAVFVWIKCDVIATLATHAAGGMQVLIGSSATAYYGYYVRGSDDYAYGGWICVPVDPTLYASASVTVGSPTPGTNSWFGARWNVPGSGASKGYPMKVDAMRHGRQIEVTAGDVSTPATWASIATYDSATTRQWGICQPTDSGVALQGLVYLGTASTAGYFDDASGGTVLFIDTEWTSADFSQIIIDHASTVFNLTGASVKALGTNNPGRLIFNNASTVSALNTNVFENIGITTLRDAVVATGNTWKGCDQITQNGATITGGLITGSTNSAALLVDTALEMADITGVSFVDNNSAPTTAASIELTATGSHTFTNITFSGGGGTPGSNPTPSSGSATADVYNNSGGAITINVSGGDTPSVRNAASSTTTVIASVSVTITIKNIAGDTLPGVEVAIFQDNAARTVVQASTPTDENGEIAASAAVSLGGIIIRARQSTDISTFNTGTGVNGTTEVIDTVANHDFQDGDKVVYSRNGGSVDIGPEPGTYYVHYISDTTLSLHATAANAIADTSREDLTSTGSETHTLDPVRYIAGSATGTIGAADFSAELALITDNIAVG